uniref:Uncharacterized protein n=1 Tax=Leptospira ellisii TaxID=2023197 RepID=A0A2N0B3C7_9LEPT|nr:hypothetical protein CH379_20930 [Leptospira ellisii]
MILIFMNSTINESNSISQENHWNCIFKNIYILKNTKLIFIYKLNIIESEEGSLGYKMKRK